MNLSIALGFLLIATAGGSYFYINMQKAQIGQLQVELQTSVNNQEVLENTISQQNTQLEEQPLDIPYQGLPIHHRQALDYLSPFYRA